MEETLMLRWLFAVVSLILAGYLTGTGIAAYRAPGAGLDSGVAAFFCAFWFFFGAAGYYLRHVWLVTIANMALVALVGLFLFLAALDLYAKGGGDTLLPWASPRAALGLIGFLFAGQVYAIVSSRRRSTRSGPDRAT
jgi:hypothetical protein